MSILLRHSANNKDPMLRPMSSLRSKIGRAIWQTVWICLCRWTPAPLHAWRIIVIRCFGGKIGPCNFIYPSARIWAPWLLETESLATIGRGVELYNVGGVFIGERAIISERAFICGATHDYNSVEFTIVPRRIVIKKKAWICAQSTVLPGVTCGEGAVLGAASLATRDLEDWSVYGGVPAKMLRERKRY